MPQKRAYRIDCSYKDEVVPDGYIGIYKLFTEEKYALPMCEKEKWCIGESILKKMRLSTYHRVKERYELCNASSYANFWNGNLDAINDLGLNDFANMLFFKDLAGAMICFEKSIENKSNHKVRKLVGWGIKDSLYRAYYKAQLEAVKTGEPLQKVNLYDAKKKRNGNLFKQKQDKLLFTENGVTRILTIDKNAVYYQFEHWCKLKGIEKSNGMYQAMMYIMLNYPAPDLKEVGAYERKSDLKYSEIIVPEVNAEETVKVYAQIPKRIHKLMCEIIRRFNLDTENIGKPSLTMEKYIIQAIDRLNQQSDLKYSNPKMYEEFLKAKKAEQYNKAVVNCKKYENVLK